MLRYTCIFCLVSINVGSHTDKSEDVLWMISKVALLTFHYVLLFNCHQAFLAFVNQRKTYLSKEYHY